MNIKRFLAIALSTTMVLGSSLTALAANGPTDTSGTISGTGAGSKEADKVNTTIVKVVIPTQETVENTLKFTVDPQRLVQGTNAAKYGEGYTFPSKSADTGVYFQTGTKEYDSKSNALWLANLGTSDVTFTINPKVVAKVAGTDIALGTKAEATAANPAAPKLYLGATLGGNAIQLATDTAAVKAVLATKPDNFHFTYDEDEEEYGFESMGIKWNGVPVVFEGAITNLAIEDTVTIPSLSLTFSWAAKQEADATDSTVKVSTYKESPAIANATIVSGQAYNYTATFTKGTDLTLTNAGITEVTTSKTINGSYAASSSITASNGTITVKGSFASNAENGEERFLKVKISGETFIIKLTIANS
ncbi:hypothetical protein [Butyrivibrio sp. MC2013]|uniref:hypothetical protein n=1 Tax=Butyrivibrio sp. MC2013 TaxID=1280686 RepID=UPI0003FC4AC0|nr:hypothetical protein [Butyrivibrio sp. MC2013]